MKEGSKSQNVGLKMERDEETTLNIKVDQVKIQNKTLECFSCCFMC